MKKLTSLAATTALALGLTIAAAAPAGAGPPCGNDGPGNSGYAAHHIVPQATDGALGNDGHKPGSHKGFSLCNPSGK